MQKPLLSEDAWADVQQTLFGRHGVIPDLQNSSEWQARFLAVQQDMPESSLLAKAVKHMSFAKQRWNSEDEPRRRFCAMLLPVSVLLAIQAEDSRQSLAFRSRCRAALQKLVPKFLINLGLSSDYSNKMMRYLRLYDSDVHDAAKTLREKAEFANRTLGTT